MFRLTDNPQRLAWTVLLASFFVCIALAVGVPALSIRILQTTTTPMTLRLENIQGTVQLKQAGQDLATAISEQDHYQLSGNGVEGAELATGEGDQAQVGVVDPQTQEVLATIQVYSGTRLRVDQAEVPRFGVSPMSNQMLAHILTGRVRITIPGDLARSLALQVLTPQFNVNIDQPGRYSVEADDLQSQVLVQDGWAEVVDTYKEIKLERDQRAVNRTGQSLDGPLPAPRNLIVNGDFSQPVEQGWQVYNKNALADDSVGTVRSTTLEGDKTVALFERSGRDHGETGIIQNLNRDVQDYRRLELQLTVWIHSQDVMLCGSFGSECPIMVEIKYRDAAGADRYWYQGYYSEKGNLNIVQCIYCSGPSNIHLQVVRDTLVSFDSGNLMDILSRPEVGPPPITIESIRVYASGHSWSSAVTDIELVAEE